MAEVTQAVDLTEIISNPELPYVEPILAAMGYIKHEILKTLKGDLMLFGFPDMITGNDHFPNLLNNLITDDFQAHLQEIYSSITQTMSHSEKLEMSVYYLLFGFGVCCFEWSGGAAYAEEAAAHLKRPVLNQFFKSKNISDTIYDFTKSASDKLFVAEFIKIRGCVEQLKTSTDTEPDARQKIMGEFQESVKKMMTDIFKNIDSNLDMFEETILLFAFGSQRLSQILEPTYKVSINKQFNDLCSNLRPKIGHSPHAPLNLAIHTNDVVKRIYLAISRDAIEYVDSEQEYIRNLHPAEISFHDAAFQHVLSQTHDELKKRAADLYTL